MCEPCHSIIQVPDDYDGPFGGGDRRSLWGKILGKGVGWIKEVGKWWHGSKFGGGHSKCMTAMRSRHRIYIPDPSLYEGIWWDRDFRVDCIRDPGKQAFDAAYEYHVASAMGNMSLFRRFLEQSMLASENPYLYVDRLVKHVLRPSGGNQLLAKLRSVFGRFARINQVMGRRSSRDDVQRGIKVVMGFTRRRDLFLPHFADDDGLWVPGVRVEG